MNSSATETQEARARQVSVTEEALTVDLMDGRTDYRTSGLVSSPVAWHVQGAEQHRGRRRWDLYPLARPGRGPDRGRPSGRSPFRRESSIVKEMAGGATGQEEIGPGALWRKPRELATKIIEDHIPPIVIRLISG